MRVFETVILAGLSLVLFGALVPRGRRPRWLRSVPALLVVLTLIHLGFERYRWQMVLAYVLMALVALFEWRRAGTAGRRVGIGRIFAVLAGALGVGLAAFLGAGVPIFSYPPPSGPHGVGSAQLFFVDRSRVDSFASAPNTPRELLAVVWYPAEVPAAARPDPFWPPGADASQAIGMPAFLFSHLPLVPSHAYAGAPMARAQARYPVIIFSHGFNSTPWQNMPQVEELASHGFIVVSLAHTYDASALVFPDGRVVHDNSRTRRPPMKLEDARKAAEMMGRVKTAPGPDEVRRAWWELVAFYKQAGFFIVPSVDMWVGDTRFLMDQLARLNVGPVPDMVGDGKPFVGRLDLDRLGVAGMSFGGSTAGSVCAIDPRCKAGLNLDGSQFGVVDEHPLSVPFMYLTAEGHNEFPVYLTSTADLYEVSVKGSAHANFDDLSLIMPAFKWISTPKLAMLGTIDAPRIERIMSTYMLAFFQRYLLGTPQPILAPGAAASEFPEVRFTARPAPSAPAPTPCGADCRH